MKEGFIITMLVVFCFGLFCSLVGIGLESPKEAEKVWDVMTETDEYFIYIFKRKILVEAKTPFPPLEPFIRFADRVWRFASTKRNELYDISYHKTNIAVKTLKGYVVTRRYPEIIFYDDGNKAAVMGWKSIDRFPIDEKEIEKRRVEAEKEKKKRTKNND